MLSWWGPQLGRQHLEVVLLELKDVGLSFCRQSGHLKCWYVGPTTGQTAFGSEFWLDVLVGCIESLRGAVLHPEHHVGWKFEILAVGAPNWSDVIWKCHWMD